jgi:hypothetical protein
MKYSFLVLSFLLLYCGTASSQTLEPLITILKSGPIKFDEFNKLDSIELNTKSLQVNRFTAYILCGEGHKNAADSICQNVFTVTVTGNSLKDSNFLNVLSKFSPPFNIIFDNIRVLDSTNNLRVILGPAIQVN